TAWRGGAVRVVPRTFVKGALGADVGGVWARTLVAPSKPGARLIRVGSLKPRSQKLVSSGTPDCVQFVGCVGGSRRLGKAAGTWMIGYPGPAAKPDDPKMKWSP